jgi:glycosyltransferase involved in cell wall biosynthesis
LVAFTSVLLLNSKKRKLILNVSDLWPIAGLELGALKKNLAYGFLEKIELFNYKNADLVLGQSEEILIHVNSIFPEKDTFLYRNYPDFNPTEILETNQSKNKLKMVYAGLLGIAQGVYKLCQELDYSNIQLHIYGAGAEKNNIETLILNNPELDIIYHGEISRKELHQELMTYDIAIIPLLNRIYGSVPSKIFEYARLGLPMIYFGGGEGENIIQKFQLGWIAKAGDYKDLNTVISKINASNINKIFKKEIQKTAIDNFNFNTQFKSLIGIIQ